MGEGEADPGDGLGRLDCGSGDASRPGSDSADVSVLHLYFGVFLYSPTSRFDCKL